MYSPAFLFIGYSLQICKQWLFILELSEGEKSKGAKKSIACQNPLLVLKEFISRVQLEQQLVAKPELPKAAITHNG